MRTLTPPILFFGTPEFALPSLEALIKNGYTVVGVVTRPDERVGRKQILTPPPVKVIAERHGIPVFQPERLAARDFAAGKIPIPATELYIVAAYGKIIPKEILDIPRLGALNIHPSLLPRWRGPAPIQYAILHGDAETGVTIIEMDEQMDHGRVVATRQRGMPNSQIPISKIPYSKLYDQLAELGAELLIEILPRWIAGEMAPVAQDESKATYSKILTRDDGRIDWKKSAEDIERMVRAFHPWPGAWTTWMRDGKPIRVRIEGAEYTPDMPPVSLPGLVWRDTARPALTGRGRSGPLAIASGRGSIIVEKIGLAGKKVLDAETFAHGYAAIIGAVLG